MNLKPIFIAEVKTASPFSHRKSPHSWDELFSLAVKYGDMLSIHTDPRWEGSFDLLKTARKRTEMPILAKGLHETDDEVAHALDCGANWVLVVGRLPMVHLDKCIIEPYTLPELATVPEGVRTLWNARDLKTGGNKTVPFREARARRKGWLCQASNIRTIADVERDADAILVGTHLPEFVRSLPLPL